MGISIDKMVRNNVLLMAFLGMFISCVHTPEDVQITSHEAVDTVYYNPTVALHIQRNCSDSYCHSESYISGFSLNDYNEVVAEAKQDRFMAAIKHEQKIKMPRIIYNEEAARKLPDSVIADFENWIKLGFLEGK